MSGRNRRGLLEEPAAGNLHGGVCEGGATRRCMVDLNGHEAGNGGHSQGTPTAYRTPLLGEGRFCANYCWCQIWPFNSRLVVVTGCGGARSGDNGCRTLTRTAGLAKALVDGNLNFNSKGGV